jgi:hypothetical protein
MKMKLGNYDEVDLTPPYSLAVCLQFTALWAGDIDRSDLAQLCAGAIGVSCEALPRYAPSASKPLDYGYMCMDNLLRAKVTPSQIYDIGSKCLANMAGRLPNEDDVQEAENFSQAGPAN